jgi:hypothetical protein
MEGFKKWLRGAMVVGAAVATDSAHARTETADLDQQPAGVSTKLNDRVQENIGIERERLRLFLDTFFKVETPQRTAFSMVASSMLPDDLALFKSMVHKVAHDRIVAGASGVGFIASEDEFRDAVYAEMIRGSEHDLSDEISRIASLAGALSKAAQAWLEKQAR